MEILRKCRFIMGCCEARKVIQSPEAHLTATECSLEIWKKSAKEIDRQSHRYSTNLIISKSQFSFLCNELQISKQFKLIKFLEMFYNSNANGYSARLISTLGILYGSGTVNEKINLLFQNYDSDSSKYLDFEEVQGMISDITKIAFEFTPELMLKNFTKLGGIEIKEFLNELVVMKPYVISYFTAKIIDEEDEGVSLIDFKKKMKEYDVKTILDPHEFRVFSSEVWKIITETAEIIENITKSKLKIDKGLAKRLSISVTESRRQSLIGDLSRISN